MLVKVPVSWQSAAYVAVVDGPDIDAVEEHEFRVDMLIDPADLVDIPHPADAGGAVSSYKRDVTALRPDTLERFRLCGCWSHKPGELIADRVLPVKEEA